MTRSRLGIAAIAATAALALTACATTDTTSAPESEPTAPTSGATVSAATDSFPVTITHAYGTTTIESEPQRVATVAWANHEVPLALGIVPVGMSKATWGDDDNDGILPWVEERLEELGGDTPVLFDETDGIDYEAVAATEPDVILAAYSGLTQEEYDTLSKIAPVVAYPEVAWGTSWQDMVRLDGAALGRSAEAEALVTELEATVADALASRPALKDAKVLFTYLDPADLSQIGFYTSHDTRSGFLLDAGAPAPTILTEESAKTDQFYVTVSAEQAEQFDDVDVMVTYGDPNSGLVDTLKADPLLSKIPAIAEGHVAVLENSTPLAAMANPSPLSIPWGLDRYLDLLDAAAPRNS